MLPAPSVWFLKTRPRRLPSSFENFLSELGKPIVTVMGYGLICQTSPDQENRQELIIHKYVGKQATVYVGLKSQVFNDFSVFQRTGSECRSGSAVRLIFEYSVLLMDDLRCVYTKDSYGQIPVKERISIIRTDGGLFYLYGAQSLSPDPFGPRGCTPPSNENDKKAYAD
jgi:hypothetical protein